MAKIINAGLIPPDPNEPAPIARLMRKEVVVTPNPKTKAQRKANAKAKRWQEDWERQQAGGHEKISKSQAKAQRRRSAKLHNTNPDAKKELATRRPAV